MMAGTGFRPCVNLTRSWERCSGAGTIFLPLERLRFLHPFRPPAPSTLAPNLTGIFHQLQLPHPGHWAGALSGFRPISYARSGRNDGEEGRRVRPQPRSSRVP
jgi:hypothetical protein